MLTLDDLELCCPVAKSGGIKHKQIHVQFEHKAIQKQKRTSTQTASSGFREVTKIGLVILVSFLIGNVVTNAQLYGERIADMMNGAQRSQLAKQSDNTSFQGDKKQEYLNTLFKTQGKNKNAKEDIYAYYKKRQESLDFQFNTLPPDKRIIIPDLGVQAPIVTVEWDIQAKMKDGEFSEELKKWAVWYPTTPGPGEKGMTMVVGHTSNYFWVKSAYNTVFSKIPQLKEGQKIQIIRDGQLYEYIMKEQKIVKPSEVDDVYKNHYDDNKKTLALMGCYPVGSRDKRIFIIAEPVQKQKIDTQFAYKK